MRRTHRRPRRLVCTLLALVVVGSGTAARASALAADKEEVASECVRVLRERPGDAEALARLRRVFTEEYPARLPGDIVRHLPVPHQVRQDLVRREAPPQEAFYTTGLSFPDSAHRRDPESKQPVTRVLHAYARRGDGDWRLAFRVLYDHHQEGAQPLAVSAMRAALRVRAAHIAHLGPGPEVLSRPVDIWIRADGAGGAEQSGNNLYLLGAGHSREPVELLRQIAHEFGHLALPPIGPLREPERWGNGFLGEVLYLRWLARAPVGGDPVVPADALRQYVQREADPLVDRFAAEGWAGLPGHETTLPGLCLLIGMVLRLDDSEGPDAVARLLKGVRGTTVRDWVAASVP